MIFFNNSAALGGAIFSTADRMMIENSEFISNSAEIGGAIKLSHTKVPNSTTFSQRPYDCGIETNNTCRENSALVFGDNWAQYL